ncbi:MAG TPA: hypothetical protein VKN99_09875 [Polyangia bacterium]|nr:hypothetical protein [Polyangia bacterium]
MRKDLGTLLLEEKVISSADLERARKLCRERGGLLAETLLEMGPLAEEDLFLILSSRLGIATIPDERLLGLTLPGELRRKIPRELARAVLVMPLELSANRRTLAVASCDPTDESALERTRVAADVEAVEAYLGRRGAILRAIERAYAGAAADEADEPAKVEIDPELAREIARLETLGADARAPLLRMVPTPPAPSAPAAASVVAPPATAGAVPMPRPPPPGVSRAEIQFPLEVVHRTASAAASRIRTYPPKSAPGAPMTTPPPGADEETPTPLPDADVASGRETSVSTPLPTDPDSEPTQVRRLPRPPRVDEDARTPVPELLRASEERHTQVLTQTVGLLVDLAEARLSGRHHAHEMGRLTRMVAREMGLAERAVAEMGLCAELFALDRSLRAAGIEPPDFVGTFGWAAGAPDGLAPMLRALTERTRRPAAGSSSKPTPPSGTPLGARLVVAVATALVPADASEGALPEAKVASEKLAAAATPKEIIEAILRVLARERASSAHNAQSQTQGKPE